MREQIDHRILGALNFVDVATGIRVQSTLNVRSNHSHFIRNRSNLYVITQADGLDEHTEPFAAPPELPPLGSISVDIDIVDPEQKYLPRRVRIALPKDPDPENHSNDNSLFRPSDITLYRNVNATVLGNWSLVRVSVDTVVGAADVVAGGFLRVLRSSDDEVLGRGLTNERGEALIIIPGVPITQFSEVDDDDSDDAPVLMTSVNARVELSVDPLQNWPVNPDLLETNHDAQLVATENVSLRTGQTETIRFNLD